MSAEEEILQLLKSHDEIFADAFLDRKATDDEIKVAEQRLGFTIPKEYVWFLKEIGHGGNMFEFMGYGLNGKAVFVEATLREREFGMPDNLMVFQNCDEFVDCINVDDGTVVTWSPYDNSGIIEVADDFYEYFIDSIMNAIDNF